MNGRIPFPFPVTPSLSLFRITHFFCLNVISIPPLESELMYLFERAVVFVIESPFDAVLQLTRIFHYRMGELLAPAGSPWLPAVTTSVESSLCKGHLKEAAGESSGKGGEFRCIECQPACQRLPSRRGHPLRTKFVKAYFLHSSLFLRRFTIVCIRLFSRKPDVK